VAGRDGGGGGEQTNLGWGRGRGMLMLEKMRPLTRVRGMVEAVQEGLGAGARQHADRGQDR
jgi:hypothetical protein